MSETDGPHPSYGGKSIESIQAQQNALKAGERQPYKSWRKKYRKMRTLFDGILEENKRLFREEQKLEGLAKRLKEELDGMMEILLDLNQNSAISPDLRYEVRLPHQLSGNLSYLPQSVVAPNIQPEHANKTMTEYINAVQSGRIPSMDLVIMRQQLQERLAEQEVKPLTLLESKTSYPMPTEQIDRLPSEMQAQHNPSYMAAEQEDAFLARLDASIPGSELGKVTDGLPASPHQADLTPRELERQMELMNPQSQHSWLKSHTKPNLALDGEDVEALPLHDTPTGAAPKPSSKKRVSGKNLAKTVGDRAMERMIREGHSPSAFSGLGEEDELATEDVAGGPRKRGGDKDPTFRAKGGKGGSVKAKRKRVTDEGAAGSGKRMRPAEIFD